MKSLKYEWSGFRLQVAGMMVTGSMILTLQGWADDPIDYIDPMIGATAERDENGRESCGRTIPGAVTPFGAVQLSPDTFTGSDICTGYSDHHTTIEGFSMLHLSGVGAAGEFGNFLFMPTVGPFYPNKGDEAAPELGYRSRYSKESEVAKAGYYAVDLVDYGIKTELTASPHVGLLRFTFPEAKDSRIQIDFGRRIGGRSENQFFEVVNENTIRGWAYCNADGGGWMQGRRLTKDLEYKVYFYAEFDKPFTKTGAWSSDIPEGYVGDKDTINTDEYQGWIKASKITDSPKTLEGRNIGFFTEFDTKAGDQVLVKASVSFVSMEGAELNLKTEVPHWDFAKVKNQAQDAWRNELAGLKVKGATDREKTIFYTGLYHMKVDPRAFSDVDGKYLGADKKTHQSKDFTYRTVFSGWDVFRSQFPLLTIIDPEIVNDEVNSLIEMATLGGKGYPRWELASQYSSCMVGDPAIPVIVDAYQKGIRNFDVEQGYALGKQTVMGPNTIRELTVEYNSLGYVPYIKPAPEDDYGKFIAKHTTSMTLENCYADWCMYVWAQALGKEDDVKLFGDRSMFYKNLYDPAKGWMRPKDSDGKFVGGWKSKTNKKGQGTIECNTFQQTWFVPHDVRGLINLMGGDERVEKELVELFEKAPDHYRFNNYYNHSNEPVHHIPYLFAYIGKPWMTQKYVREVMGKAYGLGPHGLCGNEDVGQMSAWYVFNAMGFHPVAPGDNVYVLGSPLFKEIEVELDPKYHSGKSFTVKAPNNSPENIYIQSVKLNGKELNRAWITHDEVVSGGVLEFKMGPEPNLEFGSDPAHYPPSMTTR
jgi:predicted alpha-1,2-mannosidase